MVYSMSLPENTTKTVHRSNLMPEARSTGEDSISNLT